MHLGKKYVKEKYTIETTAAEKDISVMIQENLKPSLHCFHSPLPFIVLTVSPAVVLPQWPHTCTGSLLARSPRSFEPLGAVRVQPGELGRT